MDEASALKNDLKEFEGAVARLSTGINKAGISWKDEQFKALSANIGNLAKMSRQVLMSGREYEAAIRRFQRIESEK